MVNKPEIVRKYYNNGFNVFMVIQKYCLNSMKESATFTI